MALKEIVIEDLHQKSERYREIKIEDVDYASSYLSHFGYEYQQTLDSFKRAVAHFQEYFALDVDGELGPKTLRAMEMPRCNVRDILPLESYGWSTNKLTYYVEDYVDDLPKEEIDAIIDGAFQAWENIANLQITRGNSSTANFIVGVGSGRRDGFDGPSGTLAWNELPNKSTKRVRGMVDSAETWIGKNGGRGIYLFNVLCHEFGHGLGLVHSRAKGALMAAYYSASIALPQQNDDIPRMVSIYGKKIDTPTTPTIPPAELTKIIFEISGKLDISEIKIPGYRIQKIG